MYRCERCGTSYGPIRGAGLEKCPRCRARDGVSVPLVFVELDADRDRGTTEGTRRDEE